MDTPINYFCYLRKSTAHKDRQAVSIPSQESELKPLIKRESLNVIEIFRESFSAKLRGQREIFNQMVERIEAGEANGILLWNVNRLSRNAGDTGTIIDLMDRGLLLEIKTPSQVFHNNPNDKFLLNLFCGQAKLENDSKGVDVKRGLKKKAELGWRPSNPLTGYIMVTDKYRGLIGIEPNPETFPIIRKFFKRLLKEEATIAQLYKEARDKYHIQCTTKNSVISRSTFFSLFRNTFYYGEFEWPSGSGNWYKGKHKPMLTKAEFLKIQRVLDQRIKPQRSRKVDPLPYKKLFTCRECSMSITGSRVIKRQVSGKTHKYNFYHCTKKSRVVKCSQGSIRQEKIESTVLNLLDSLWLPADVVEWSLEKSKEELLNHENTDYEKRHAASTRKLSALKNRYDNLINMRADNEIDKATFAAKETDLKTKIDNLEVALSARPKSNERYLKSLEEELNFVYSAQERFRKGNKSTKRAIIKRIGSNRYVEDRKLIIEPKMELAAIQKLKNSMQARIGRLKPISSLNKKTLGTLHAKSPIWRGRLY